MLDPCLPVFRKRLLPRWRGALRGVGSLPLTNFRMPRPPGDRRVQGVLLGWCYRLLGFLLFYIGSIELKKKFYSYHFGKTGGITIQLIKI